MKAMLKNTKHMTKREKLNKTLDGLEARYDRYVVKRDITIIAVVFWSIIMLFVGIYIKSVAFPLILVLIGVLIAKKYWDSYKYSILYYKKKIERTLDEIKKSSSDYKTGSVSYGMETHNEIIKRQRLLNKIHKGDKGPKSRNGGLGGRYDGGGFFDGGGCDGGGD